MDRHQLIVIAITAVISVIAKELVIWLVGLAKVIALSDPTRQRLKKIFSKRNRNIVLDILIISFLVWTLARDLRNPSPMVRMDIIRIILDLVCLVAFVVLFIIHIWGISGRITVSWGDEKEPPPSK